MIKFPLLSPRVSTLYFFAICCHSGSLGTDKSQTLALLLKLIFLRIIGGDHCFLDLECNEFFQRMVGHKLIDQILRQKCFRPCVVGQLYYQFISMNQENKHVATKLIKITLLSLLFMGVQLLGGYLAHSIAIWADAFHLLSDVLAYVISLVAVWLSEKQSPFYLTFGWQKAQPLGALFNIIFIYIVTIELFIEATHRMIKQEIVEEPIYMLITSIFGLICNLIILSILHNDPNGGHSGCSHGHNHKQHHQELEHRHDHSHQHGDQCTGRHLPLTEVSKTIANVHQQSKCTHDHSHHEHQHSDSHQHHHEHKEHQHHHEHQEHQHHHEHEMNDEVHAHKQKQHCSASKEAPHLHQKDECLGKQRHSGDQICMGKRGKKKAQVSIEDGLLGSVQSDQQIKGHSHSKKQNINLQAAYIHIITDIILSIGVIISALVIYFLAPTHHEWTAWQLADPLCTYLFSILAVYSTWPILKQSLLLLLDACEDPQLIRAVERELKEIEEVREVVELKVWSTSRGKHYAAVRVRMAKGCGCWRVRRVLGLRGVQSFVEVEEEQTALTDDS